MSGGGPVGLKGHPGGGTPRGPPLPGGNALGLYGHCIPFSLDIISAVISGENGPKGPIGGRPVPSGPPPPPPLRPLKLNGGKLVVGEEEVDVVEVPEVVVGNCGKLLVGGMVLILLLLSSFVVGVVVGGSGGGTIAETTGGVDGEVFMVRSDVKLSEERGREREQKRKDRPI